MSLRTDPDRVGPEVAAAGAAPAAADPAADLLAAQREATGLAAASSRWDVQELGGGASVGGVRRAPERRAPQPRPQVHRGPAVAAALPGAGQLYNNGDRDRALAFAGAEAAVWTAYYVFHSQATGYSESYRDYAQIFAGVQESNHTRTTGAPWAATWRARTSTPP